MRSFSTGPSQRNFLLTQTLEYWLLTYVSETATDSTDSWNEGYSPDAVTSDKFISFIENASENKVHIFRNTSIIVKSIRDTSDKGNELNLLLETDLNQFNDKTDQKKQDFGGRTSSFYLNDEFKWAIDFRLQKFIHKEEVSDVEAENAKLKQIIEENARRDARAKELEQKNTELEARLAIVEQGSSVVDDQLHKEAISKRFVEQTVSDVDLSSSVTNQRNNDDAKTSEEKEMDAFLVEVNKKSISDKIRESKKEVEQDLRRELSSTEVGDGKINKAFDFQIPELSLEAILMGSSEVTAQNIVDLFRVAMKLRRKEILCWYRDVKSKNGVDDKSARTLVYSEIKPLLPEITNVNLRKITFRAKKIYILFDEIGTIEST
ncbi:hypothetical protein C1646_771717 [Rhizophagus diaphanus]|nr:hypothetical protein C1646_771717 [Rhizophagus diaphanus] [Rhizophagus sp. MUCL 43196]